MPVSLLPLRLWQNNCTALRLLAHFQHHRGICSSRAPAYHHISGENAAWRLTASS